MKTWIKFCGTASLDDALASIEAGADALGFIFAASKRRISAEKAREILGVVPERVERVGVFLDQSVEEVRGHVMALNLTAVQLHGEESAEALCKSLTQDRRESLRIIRTVLVKDGFAARLQADLEVDKDAVDAWLLDSGAGSGRAFDWQLARRQLAGRQGRFIIAGGLTPENVGDAIRLFRPWGVDVATGIEREPGRKDREKMRAFVAAVRRAEQQ
jgi:phosphoribosylanthranilate isomerase